MTLVGIMRRRPYLVGSVVGFFSFVVPLYMLVGQRSPVVETTGFHMTPLTAKPGQKIEAIWTDHTLRLGCEGLVYRRFIGADETWVLNAVHTVHHPDLGGVRTFHSTFKVPNMPPGPAKFHKDIKRWCNFFQAWLWPMHETQEAEFVVEPMPEPRQP
jgi:hypothetical protein